MNYCISRQTIYGCSLAIVVTLTPNFKMCEKSPKTKQNSSSREFVLRVKAPSIQKTVRILIVVMVWCVLEVKLTLKTVRKAFQLMILLIFLIGMETARCEYANAISLSFRMQKLRCVMPSITMLSDGTMHWFHMRSSYLSCNATKSY